MFVTGYCCQYDFVVFEVHRFLGYIYLYSIFESYYGQKRFLWLFKIWIFLFHMMSVQYLDVHVHSFCREPVTFAVAWRSAAFSSVITAVVV